MFDQPESLFIFLVMKTDSPARRISGVITLAAHMLMICVFSMHQHVRLHVSGSGPRFSEHENAEAGTANDCTLCVMHGQWSGDLNRALPSFACACHQPLVLPDFSFRLLNDGTEPPSRGPPPVFVS